MGGGGGGGETVHIEDGGHHDVGFHPPQHGFGFGDGHGYVMGSIGHVPEGNHGFQSHEHGSLTLGHGYGGGSGLSEAIISHGSGPSGSIGGHGLSGISSAIGGDHLGGIGASLASSGAPPAITETVDESHVEQGSYGGSGGYGAPAGYSSYGGGAPLGGHGISQELTTHGIKHNLMLASGGGLGGSHGVSFGGGSLGGGHGLSLSGNSLFQAGGSSGGGLGGYGGGYSVHEPAVDGGHLQLSGYSQSGALYNQLSSSYGYGGKSAYSHY